MKVQGSQTNRPWFIRTATVLSLTLPLWTGAADIRITDFDASLDHGVTVHFQSPASGNYHVLLRGDTAQQISTPVDISLNGGGTLIDTSSIANRSLGFYRVVAWPRTEPGDSDQDGIDDLFEIDHPELLSPLNPHDAGLDPDADGRPNLWEYRQHTQLNAADWATSTPIAWGTYRDSNASTWVLKRDGSLWTVFPPTQIAPQMKFRSTAAGAAIATDGSLWAWGNLWYDNGIPPVLTPGGQVGVDHDWTAVARSMDHALALKQDGSLWAWGSNPDGRLGTPPGEFGDFGDRTEPTRIGTGTDWVFVSTGLERSLAIKADGTLWWWGNWSPVIKTPTQVGTDHDWIAVSHADVPVLAIKRNGTLWGWGLQFSDPVQANLLANPPTQVGTDSNWVAAASAYGSVVLQSDGTAWTVNLDGGSLVRVKTGEKSVAAAANGSIDAEGRLWSWNGSPLSWSGFGSAVARVDQPTQVGTDHDWKGSDYTAAIKQDGSAWAWGHNSVFTWQHDPDTGSNAPARVEHQPTGLAGVSMGSFHALGLASDGSLWSWGRNADGQLGYHGPSPRWTPAQVGTSKAWSKVAAGRAHSLAVRKDGTLWGWGLNTFGQAGGPSSNRVILPPTQVGTDTQWTEISAGRDQSLGIKADGTLWGWGNNESRQLGLNSPEKVEVPTQIGLSADWSAIAAGFDFSLAIKRDGALWMFGFKQFPHQVGTAKHWRTVSAGVMVALTKTDGTAWTVRYWRNSFPYSFGDLSTNLVQVDSDTHWISLSAGKEHSFTGVKEDGTLWAWGENEYGGTAQPVGFLPLPVIGQEGFGWPTQ